MEKRYQIFISSTYKDLIVERQKVVRAILKLYHFPIGMEMFHADNEEQWIQIKNTIDMSDYYILILGRYCGTLIENEGISYTEKEYDYALSKGIPILSFVISDNAKKESYGEETAKQRRAFAKFKQKVLRLPCSFWTTADELLMQVATTLSIKFLENNRRGWVPYAPMDIYPSSTISSIIAGEYVVLYYSVLKSSSTRLIYSILTIESSGKAAFYNNIKTDNFSEAEYTYHGSCIDDGNSLFAYLKNDYSNERIVMTLTKSVGNLQRFIGLLTGLSANSIPICVKISCFKRNIYNKGINISLLERILCEKNKNYNSDVLMLEEKQKHLFFSDEILNNP